MWMAHNWTSGWHFSEFYVKSAYLNIWLAIISRDQLPLETLPLPLASPLPNVEVLEQYLGLMCVLYCKLVKDGETGVATFGLNEKHHGCVVSYLRFARTQRSQHLKSIDACLAELKSSRSDPCSVILVI